MSTIQFIGFIKREACLAHSPFPLHNGDMHRPQVHVWCRVSYRQCTSRSALTATDMPLDELGSRAEPGFLRKRGGDSWGAQHRGNDGKYGNTLIGLPADGNAVTHCTRVDWKKSRYRILCGEQFFNCHKCLLNNRTLHTAQAYPGCQNGESGKRSMASLAWDEARRIWRRSANRHTNNRLLFCGDFNDVRFCSWTHYAFRKTEKQCGAWTRCITTCIDVVLFGFIIMLRKYFVAIGYYLMQPWVPSIFCQYTSSQNILRNTPNILYM